jgi:hypothetical protein
MKEIYIQLEVNDGELEAKMQVDNHPLYDYPSPWEVLAELVKEMESMRP